MDTVLFSLIKVYSTSSLAIPYLTLRAELIVTPEFPLSYRVIAIKSSSILNLENSAINVRYDVLHTVEVKVDQTSSASDHMLGYFKSIISDLSRAGISVNELSTNSSYTSAAEFGFSRITPPIRFITSDMELIKHARASDAVVSIFKDSKIPVSSEGFLLKFTCAAKGDVVVSIDQCYNPDYSSDSDLDKFLQKLNKLELFNRLKSVIFDNVTLSGMKGSYAIFAYIVEKSYSEYSIILFDVTCTSKASFSVVDVLKDIKKKFYYFTPLVADHSLDVHAPELEFSSEFIYEATINLFSSNENLYPFKYVLKNPSKSASVWMYPSYTLKG